MDKILDIISKWDHVGQGFFFLVVLGMGVGLIKLVFDGLVILCRGHAPCTCKKTDEEDD